MLYLKAFVSLSSARPVKLNAYCDAFLSLVSVARYSFGVAETADIPAVDKEVCHILAVHNATPADADISVFDDSYKDLAKAEDYAEVHLAVADCNLAAEYVLHPVEKAVTVVDCRMKERVNAVRRPKIIAATN